MPVYEYRCSRCRQVTSLTAAVGDMAGTVDCERCGAPAERILSRPSVHLSRASKLERLDPRYDRMVDKAMHDTQQAEPDRLLKKMKPFPADDG